MDENMFLPDGEINRFLPNLIFEVKWTFKNEKIALECLYPQLHPKIQICKDTPIGMTYMDQ